MEYILRVAVHEDAWRRQLTELLSLFESTPIREVMLMEESHKILMSAFPREKHLRMVAIYNEMARAFEKAGIRFSINLVTCVGHGDNAVPERLRLPFTRFTGEELEPSNAVYCISDAAWVEYTAGICALYAETKPTRLMLDDDFRSLNHTSRYGCFCENHVRMTSERLGFPVTKEQLRDAVCGIGSDAEKIKAAWLKVNFEVQLHAAKEIERAIHTVSPKTQVGLMNSGEPAHSIQGRDMNELLRAFAGEGQCLSRPLGGAYSDVLHRGIPAMISGMSLSMAAVEEDICWVSEVENYPNSLYNKSIALTKLQLQLHTLAGADALTLNLYDYLATPLPLQEEYARAVREADSSVQTLAQLRSGKHMRGVGLPWRKDAAEHRRNLSRTLDGAMPKRPLDDILPLLGIPVQFTPAETNVLLGDDVLCYTRHELEEFLLGGLVLDNIAAEYLYDMGFGPFLGCTPVDRVEEPCVEEITCREFGGEWTGTLICTDWDAVRRSGEWITRFVPVPGAVEICRLLDEEKRYLAPSMLLYNNAKGGKICVMAVPVQECGWLCRGRAVLMQKLFGAMPGGSLLPVVGGDMNLAPFYYEDADGEGLLGIVNCGLDGAQATAPRGLYCTEVFGNDDGGMFHIPPVSAKFYRCRRNDRQMVAEGTEK